MDFTEAASLWVICNDNLVNLGTAKPSLVTARVIKTVPNYLLNHENHEPKYYPELFGVKYRICNNPLSNWVNRQIAPVNHFNPQKKFIKKNTDWSALNISDQYHNGNA